MISTPIHIVFLLITYLLVGDVDPSGSFASLHIKEVPFPAGSTITDCEMNKSSALADALMQGEVDANAMWFDAKCEDMVLVRTTGG